MLFGIREREPGLDKVEVELLSPEVLGLYKGVDLNSDLLDQAEDIYGHNPKMVFEQADFTQGLPLDENEPPYDLYFTSYGTCSHHNDDKSLIHLLADIANKTGDYCVIVCDWLGRYSYEWQTLWANDLSENQNMDYLVSYIYEKEEREAGRDELQHLTLRLMSRQEAEDILARASRRAGVKIAPLKFFDRSIFTGRHMDTAEYNPHAQPIRNAVNSLHEPNMRTYLSPLMVDYSPLQVEEGEPLVLIGTSGCGKTTTLKMINRLIEPTSGSIFVNGADISRVDPIELRRNIGYAIQEVGLFPHMTVAENIGLVPRLKGWDEDRKQTRCARLLEMVGLNPDESMNRYPVELSGGQQQRVGVARALAADPPIILMDEPFGALDPITREQLQDEFLQLKAKIKKTIVFVTHDIYEAFLFGDRIAIMNAGRVLQVDTPDHILNQPADDVVSRLVGRHRSQLLKGA